MSDNRTATTCPHNPEVDCSEPNCARCGWNPEVSAQRVYNHIKSRFQHLKPYKIEFKGYCEVWAESPEDAIDKASNEEMFFVHYEFNEPKCLEKEETDEMER